MKRRAFEQWDAGYVRVSTDMQVERDALQNQVQALEAHGAVHGVNQRGYMGSSCASIRMRASRRRTPTGPISSGSWPTCGPGGCARSS